MDRYGIPTKLVTVITVYLCRKLWISSRICNCFNRL